MRSLIYLISVLIAFLWFGKASATIINVPADFSTIQMAIDSSLDADTALVQPGTYVENLNLTGHNIVFGSLFLTTGDTSYISQTVIDGDSSGTVVVFGEWQDSSTAIVGFTITNGLGAGTFPDFEGGGITCLYQAKPRIYRNIITGNSAYAGGGITCRQHADAVIQQNTITANSTYAGGGIYCLENNAKIIDNEIDGNTATEYGGGIYSRCQSLINNNRIINNNSHHGGGIYCYSSNAIIDSNIISDNAAGFGGGIECHWYSASDIINNIISGNNSNSAGGGIRCEKSSPDIIDNVIHGNSSFAGGGVYLYDSDPPMSENVISENMATTNGGGIYCDDSNPSATNNTLYLNYAAGNGGGIYCEEVYLNSLNNIFWADSAGSGNEIYINSGSPSFNYCNIQGGWTGEGNIDCDPMFCNPDSGDFYLDGNSCCVGAGQNGEIIGAKEIGCWPACDNYVTGDVNGSNSYNGLDILYGVAFLKGGQPPGYLCECIIGLVFYAMGDVNGSCDYNGLDITYGVSYLKGMITELFPCADCPPVGD